MSRGLASDMNDDIKSEKLKLDGGYSLKNQGRIYVGWGYGGNYPQKFLKPSFYK